MARNQKRDSRGRFSSSGKVGKSAKNESARAKYKEASGKARELTKMASNVASNPKASAKEKAFWNRQAGGAKSGLTRVSNNLSGKGKKAGGSGVAAARAAGRAKGKAMAAKTSARNAALDRKAAAYGGGKSSGSRKSSSTTKRSSRKKK
jgi:hypothetical protein